MLIRGGSPAPKSKNIMTREVVRSQESIDYVLNKSAYFIDEGSRYPGASYEEGIIAFAEWLFGDTEDEPFE